jgi:ADP-ribosylglycohydrolase
MLGAIAGDIICEAAPTKTRELPLLSTGATFTDDTVCTVAIADALLTGGDFAQCLRAYVHCYPDPRGTAAGSHAGPTHRACQHSSEP